MKRYDPNEHSDFAPAIVAALGRLDWIARAIVAGIEQGAHRSTQRGFSTEFSEHRPYARGDDPRFLDWRVYARTRKPYVRCFEAETNLECCLLLDGSRSMDWYWEDTPSKLRYAINLCSALSYLLIKNRDRVGLLAAGDSSRIRWVPPASRLSHFNRLICALEATTPGTAPVLAALARAHLVNQCKRGQIVLFSDLEEDKRNVEQALADLAGAGYEILVVHILHTAEIKLPFGPETTHIQDSETGLRAPVDMDQLKRDQRRQVEAFTSHWTTVCATHGIDYVFLDTGMDYVEALRRILETKRANRGT